MDDLSQWLGFIVLVLYAAAVVMIIWAAFRMIEHTCDFMRYAAKIKRAEWERMEKERGE